ncbi:transposase [Candidatus Sumerlaeota bacterium]|nr:transposase [Candidatus Sumerlaeota bacterium]
MARQRRINLPSCLYHVICRSNPGCCLFLKDADRRHFLKSLEKYSELFQFKIHAFCLMDTHVHLLAESAAANLSEFMRRLILSHTVWFHQRHDTHGHLFSGRFKSLVVDKEAYLLALTRYIHLNPVESGIVKKAEDYPWSSLCFYAAPHIAPPFLYTRETLLWFGGNPQEYLRYIREGLDEGTKPNILKQRYIGAEHFAKRINAMQEAKMGIDPGTMEKEKREQIYAETRLKMMCQKLGCKVEFFKAKRKKDKKYLYALVVLVYLLRENTEWSYRKIAEFTGISTIYAQKVYGNTGKMLEIKEIKNWIRYLNKAL